MHMQNLEKRLEGRFLCADLVRVTWRKGDAPREIEAVLEDISPLGACVQIDEEIPVGAPITLSAGAHTLSGQVSYCVFRDYGYFAGIRLSDETHWSVGVYVPRHLTSLKSLGADPSRRMPD